MPFARWKDFASCETEMMNTGHDKESADKICGSIQARAEKGELYKSCDQENYDIISKSSQDLIIGGFASWELVDPENDLITTEAQVNYLQKLFKLPVEYRNIMVKHGNYKIGTPLLKYQAADGTEHFSHVNEKGLYLLAKIRNDEFQTTQKWRNKILNGEMSMYSIAGQPLPPIKEEMQGTTSIRTIVDIEPWEITICEKGVNPKANFKVLAKQEELLEKQTCNTDKCHGACCSFITQWEPRKDSDLKKYMALHGVICKEDESGTGMWLKMPVRCQALDPETYLCKIYKSRPGICSFYPKRESPFIRKEECSMLTDTTETIHKENLSVFESFEEFRPKCEAACKGLVADPKEFCGAFWTDKEQEQYWHGPLRVELLKALMKAESKVEANTPTQTVQKRAVTMYDAFDEAWNRKKKSE